MTCLPDRGKIPVGAPTSRASCSSAPLRAAAAEAWRYAYEIALNALSA
jgi:hypothetical protein